MSTSCLEGGPGGQSVTMSEPGRGHGTTAWRKSPRGKDHEGDVGEDEDLDHEVVGELGALDDFKMPHRHLHRRRRGLREVGCNA
eukprot:829940-Rhodomonas_salina.2